MVLYKAIHSAVKYPLSKVLQKTIFGTLGSFFEWYCIIPELVFLENIMRRYSNMPRLVFWDTDSKG